MKVTIQSNSLDVSFLRGQPFEIILYKHVGSF